MHRERLERAERARLERAEALEKELLAKQRRAEKLRQEQLQQRRGRVARFNRRPLGPSSNHEPPDTITSERKQTSVDLHHKENRPRPPPPATSGQRSMPTTPLSMLAHPDDRYKRCMMTSRASCAPLRSLSSTLSKSSRRTDPDESFETPHEDICTGRGLVFDENELRKVSVFNSTPHSDHSSSRESFEIIEPKATSLALADSAPPPPPPTTARLECLSQTPIPPHSSSVISLAAPQISPQLATVSEGGDIAAAPKPSRTPMLAPRSALTIQSRRLQRPIPGTSRVTPIDTRTPVPAHSPNSVGCMAPRRRGSLSSVAIIQGITSGTAMFIDTMAKRSNDDLNTWLPIPPKLAHLFAYSTHFAATPLTIAAKASSAELVKALIEAPVNVFSRDCKNRTLLHQVFLPLPEDMAFSKSAQSGNTPPYRTVEPIRPASHSTSISPRTSLLQTPRINEHELNNFTQPSLCRLLEAAQPLWASNLDNRANIVELLVCAGISPALKDDDGKVASDYAKEWLFQAHRELEDPNSSNVDKISACCIRGACLALLTLEDYLKLSYLAPLTTSYKMRKLLRPRLGASVIGGVQVSIRGNLLGTDRTPERVISLVRGKCNDSATRRKARTTRPRPVPTTDPLNLFLKFARQHRDHPAPLKILEFLGAAFQ